MCKAILNQGASYDEIDLNDVFRVIKESRKLLFSITAVFAAISLVIALILPNKYTADLVLAPTDSENGGLSGALSQLGGFASLAGVSLGVGESYRYQNCSSDNAILAVCGRLY